MAADVDAVLDGTGPSEERLSTVLRLTTAVSEKVLDAQIMNRPVPEEQVKALSDAALLLKEQAIPLPPLLMQVLHETGASVLGSAVAGRKTSDQSDEEPPADGGKGTGLSRLLRPFRGPT